MPVIIRSVLRAVLCPEVLFEHLSPNAASALPAACRCRWLLGAGWHQVPPGPRGCHQRWRMLSVSTHGCFVRVVAQGPQKQTSGGEQFLVTQPEKMPPSANVFLGVFLQHSVCPESARCCWVPRDRRWPGLGCPGAARGANAACVGLQKHGAKRARV